MARETRAQRILPGQPNHIMVRGNNRRRLFSYPYERRSYLGLLTKALVKRECQLHAICLMSNHVHLLLTPPTVEAASSCMKRVNQRYAQLRNARRNGSGKLFEQSFESKPVTSERQLMFTVMYIEANPHRAYLPPNRRYEWSSYGIHAGVPKLTKISARIVTFDSWYLGLANTPSERAQQYAELFHEYLASDEEPEHAARFTALEEQASGTYGRRLLRPDGSSAAEPRFYVYAEKPNDDPDLE